MFRSQRAPIISNGKSPLYTRGADFEVRAYNKAMGTLESRWQSRHFADAWTQTYSKSHCIRFVTGVPCRLFVHSLLLEITDYLLLSSINCDSWFAVPSSPPPLCRECSARAVNATPYCAAHQNAAKERNSFYESYRADDPHRKLYRNKRWAEKLPRRIVLNRDILCVECKHKAATECDHVIRARIIVEQSGLDAFYNPANCQGLCHSCHSQKTAQEWKH